MAIKVPAEITASREINIHDEAEIERRKLALTASVAKYKLNLLNLERAPKLSEIFEQTFGDLPRVLNAMRFSTDDTLIKRFLAVYDEASPEDRWILPWEGFCLAADIKLSEFRTFVGAVMLATQSVSANKVKMILFNNHPDTVMARVENAKQPWGVKDRDAIDMELGLLASPKGATIINKQIIQQGDSGAGDPETDVDIDLAFPMLAETQKNIKRLPPSRRAEDRELDDREDA